MITQASMALRHQTVFLEEIVDALVWHDGGVCTDGTLRRGGHNRHILKRLGSGDRFVVSDKDPAAVTETGTVEDTHFIIEYDNFAQMVQCLDARGIKWVAGVLLDLSTSSLQTDEGARGFSSRMDGSLDMRMGTTCGIIAAQQLAEVGEYDIARVIRDYGEEWFVVRIAKTIVARRG